MHLAIFGATLGVRWPGAQGLPPRDPLPKPTPLPTDETTGPRFERARLHHENMASFNRVILMGNLTRDPEVRYANSGAAIVKFALAVNRRWQNAEGQWQDEATFVDITMFGKRGEAFSRFHQRGKPALIEGHLRLDQWDDKQTGAKRSKLYVVADTWEFVGGGREGGGEGGAGGGGYQNQRGGGQQAGTQQGGDAPQAGAPQGGDQGNYGGAPQSDAPAYVDDTPF